MPAETETDTEPGRAASQPRPGFVRRVAGSVGGPGITGNVPIVALGAAVGLVGGYLLGSLDSGTYSATTVVNGNVVGTSSPPELTSSDIIGTYTATELSFFTYMTKRISANIAEQTGQASPTPPVAVVEKGTALLDITASGNTADEAAKASTIAADMYVADWRARSIESINQQIAATRATIEEVGADEPGGAELQTQLASQLYDLQATQTAVRLVKPATPAVATYTSSGTTIALLGAIVGTMGGLGVLLVCRRRRAADSIDG